MKKRYVFLSMVWGAFALIVSINNLTTVKLKYFAYQDIIKEYNWGQMKVRLDGNWREENSNLSILGNPYSINLFIDKNLSDNSSDNCIAKLNYLLLKNNNDNILSVSEKTDAFEDTFPIGGISTNTKLAAIYLENIFLEGYYSHNVSFQVDIVCDGKVTNSIKEKNLIFYTNYYEENLSLFDRILWITQKSDRDHNEIRIVAMPHDRLMNK